jgi:lipopolysaccharide transport system ATP-binding protein
MAAVQNLCQTGVLLAKGRVMKLGPVNEVVRDYLSQADRISQISLADRNDRNGTGALRFTRVTLRDAADEQTNVFACGAVAVFDLHVKLLGGRSFCSVRISVGIDNHLGHRILNLSTNLAGEDFAQLPADVDTIRLRIPRMTLTPGRYGFTLFASVNGETADWVVNVGSFDVEGGDYYGTGNLPPAGPGQGYFLMEHAFELPEQAARAAVPAS